MTFSQGTIQLPPDSTGKILDTNTGTRGASTIHRPIHTIGGFAAAAIADVLNAAPTGSEYGILTRPIGGSAGTPGGAVLSVQGVTNGTILNINSPDFNSGVTNLAALNAAVSISGAGGSTFVMSITGVYVGTIIVEYTIDQTNWFTLTIVPVNGGAPITAALPSAATGQWIANNAGYATVRARMSAWTSGTAAVTLRSTAGNGATQIMGPLETTTGALRVTESKSLTMVTATAAGGSAATATVPAAGAGLFNYISLIQISAFASAAVTGSATKVDVTTTGITNTPSFMFGNAKAIGTIETQEMEFSPPLKGSAANTAATVVGPATTGFLWRVNVAYYTST